MAVVIRFNTIVVRKSSIEAKWPGRLSSYRQEVVPRELTYFEDQHLAVAYSMGGQWAYWDLLQNGPLVYEQENRFVDIAVANQRDGVDPRCEWLEYTECCGFPVCWLKGVDPDFVVDSKPVRRMALQWASPVIDGITRATCANCSKVLGLAAAVAAIDVEEYRHGPLGKIFDNPNRGKSEFIVHCPHCGHKSQFDEQGRPVAVG